MIAAGSENSALTGAIKVVKEGERRHPHEGRCRTTESDAMQHEASRRYVHGMLKMDSYAAARCGRRTSPASVTFDRGPKERRINESRLEARFSPTLAGAMVDALPYLVDYPYGCTEQTLNRFLPTVITQKILLDMQLDLKAVQRETDQLKCTRNSSDDAELLPRSWKRFEP